MIRAERLTLRPYVAEWTVTTVTALRVRGDDPLVVAASGIVSEISGVTCHLAIVCFVTLSKKGC